MLFPSSESFPKSTAEKGPFLFFPTQEIIPEIHRNLVSYLRVVIVVLDLCLPHAGIYIIHSNHIISYLSKQMLVKLLKSERSPF